MSNTERESEELQGRTYQTVTGGALWGLVIAGIFLSLVALAGYVEVVGYTAGPVLALFAALLSFDRYEVVENCGPSQECPSAEDSQ